MELGDRMQDVASRLGEGFKSLQPSAVAVTSKVEPPSPYRRRDSLRRRPDRCPIANVECRRGMQFEVLAIIISQLVRQHEGASRVLFNDSDQVRHSRDETRNGGPARRKRHVVRTNERASVSWTFFEPPGKRTTGNVCHQFIERMLTIEMKRQCLLALLILISSDVSFEHGERRRGVTRRHGDVEWRQRNREGRRGEERATTNVHPAPCERDVARVRCEHVDAFSSSHWFYLPLSVYFLRCCQLSVVRFSSSLPGVLTTVVRFRCRFLSPVTCATQSFVSPR
jgi:hypothetical protein